MSLLAAFALAAAAANEPGDLLQMRDAMRCVASAAPRQTATVLDSDFRVQPAYGRAMDRLLQDNSRCVRFSTMRARGVVVPGYLAEAVLAKDVAAAMPEAVAYRRERPSIAARDQGEAIALCTVRAKPAESWALFQTAPASPEEKAALAALIPAVAECTPSSAQAKFNRPGLRAILALGYRRIVNHNRATAS